MILLCNSDEFTVSAFDFFHFSPEETETEVSDETKNMIFPELNNENDFENDNENDIDNDFENDFDNDLGIRLKGYDKKPEVSHKKNSETSLEDERKRRAEIKAEAEKIISAAKMQADEILKKAESDAVTIKEKAHSEGLDEGYNEGFNQAYEKNKAELEEETASYLLELRDLLNEYKVVKDRLISQNIDELKDVAITIAEKVIHVSLKTSGEVIKKMIISATEKMRYQEWARIYISRSEASLFIEGYSDLLRSIANVSENIKIIAMEDAAPGTCIIELPNQVIDASASTQIENIRGVLKGVDINGGNKIV